MTSLFFQLRLIESKDLLKLATYNSTYPKGVVSFSADTFVQAESSVLRMKFSGKNPALRVAAKRWHSFKTTDQMNIIFKVFLILHIFGGSVGLLTGMLNIVRKKGDKNHKLVGRVFLISMLTAGISSLILASIHTNYFLFMVGVFTLYMVGSGQLYLKGHNNTTSKSIEWTITILMLLAGILFVGFGVLALAKTNLFGLVFVTFGCLGLLFVRQDFKNIKGQSAIKNYGLVAHLQRMTGGFIAALTAFLVVNAEYFPEQIPSFLYWLLPTIFLTPLIIKWSRKYEVKKK